MFYTHTTQTQCNMQLVNVLSLFVPHIICELRHSARRNLLNHCSADPDTSQDAWQLSRPAHTDRASEQRQLRTQLSEEARAGRTTVAHLALDV